MEEESQRCPHCGTFRWEWEMDQKAYEVEMWKCEGCARREGAQHTLIKTDSPPATKFGLRPVLVRGSD